MEILKFLCPAHIPDQLNQNPWGGIRTSLIFETLQMTPRHSQMREPLMENVIYATLQDYETWNQEAESTAA